MKEKIECLLAWLKDRKIRIREKESEEEIQPRPKV